MSVKTLVFLSVLSVIFYVFQPCLGLPSRSVTSTNGRTTFINRGHGSGSYHQPAKHSKNVALVFDVDGVLLKGKTPLACAIKAMKKVRQHNIPFIMLTNGGGVTEVKKAKELGILLQTPIYHSQVVLGHSPMKLLARKYADELVLFIGAESIREVAKEYGFKRVVMPSDVADWNPSICPFRDGAVEKNSTIDFSQERFAAIFAAQDSMDWGCDLQISIDILRSQNGLFGSAQSEESFTQAVPVYFGAGDLLWSNEWPIPRFGQGAFKHAMSALLHELTGAELVSTTYGKPEHATYEYAIRVMEDHILSEHEVDDEHPLQFYAFGDNPISDIEGANNQNWHSILVRTGVWNEVQHGNKHNASIVVHNVLEGVEYVIAREEL